MKRCPRCDKTYPESETFCETDGTALISGGPAFVADDSPAAEADAPSVECPVCGGKAQPGELICNFCGARLGIEPSEAARMPPLPPPAGPARTSRVQPGSSPSMRITGRMAEGEDDEAPRRGPIAVIGYVLAAVIALGGGAWLALHLSSGSGPQPVAEASKSVVASPATAPIPTGPSVALAAAMGVQVTGDSASAPERSNEAARKVFEDNKNSLLDPYTHALASDSSTRDAMVLRLRVLPTGAVDAASVRTSTNPNPGLDAEVVKQVSSWSFAPFSGGQVEVDYPVIFTNDPATREALDSQLKTKLASLSPTEAPEFASAPAQAQTPEAAVAPSPAEVAAPAESTPAAEAAPAPRRRPRREVARPAPTPTLQQRVKEVLASNPKLRRVDCYTSGGTVTIFGKVFDADAKQLAERVVGRVPGVSNVIDSLSTDESDWAARQNKIAMQLANSGLSNVTIKVIGHDAYLGGTVKSEADKQRAVTIAESAAPVQVRTNLITVEIGNMFGF